MYRREYISYESGCEAKKEQLGSGTEVMNWCHSGHLQCCPAKQELRKKVLKFPKAISAMEKGTHEEIVCAVEFQWGF